MNYIFIVYINLYLYIYTNEQWGQLILALRTDHYMFMNFVSQLLN